MVFAPDNMLYNMGFQLKQGEIYKDGYKAKEEGTIENFDNLDKSKYMLNNTRANIVANEDNQQMHDLTTTYNAAADDFSSARSSLNQKEEHFIQAESKSNPYLGKNINIKDVGLAYVTDKGFYKPYTSTTQFNNISGKSSCLLSSNAKGCCPTSTAAEDVDLDKVALTRGTHMSNTQGCGNEGKNLYINQTAVPENLAYDNCYKATDDSSAEQTELGTNVKVMDCAQRAADNNKNVFSLQKGSIGEDQCFVWDKLPTHTDKTGTENLYSINDKNNSTHGTPVLVMLKNGQFKIWFVGASVLKLIKQYRTQKLYNDILSTYIALYKELNKNGANFSDSDFFELVGGAAEWKTWLTSTDKNGADGNSYDVCDPAYGGGINSATATWGANLGAEDGNWTAHLEPNDGHGLTSNTIKDVGTQHKRHMGFFSKNWAHCHEQALLAAAAGAMTVVTLGGGAALAAAAAGVGGTKKKDSKCYYTKYNEPSPGDPKNFTIDYQCGLDRTKSDFEIKSSGNGAQKGDAYNLNCVSEVSNCGSFSLNLSDEGTIDIIRYNDNSKTLILFKQDDADWKTRAIVSTEWGTSSKNMGDSLNDMNVLIAGEFLTDSSNKFQLILQKNGVLELNMAVKACLKFSEDCGSDACPEYYHPDYKINNPPTSAYYTFDTPNNKNLNKAGYITDDGKLKEYPNNMITKAGNTFTKSPAYMLGGKYKEINTEDSYSSSPATTSVDDMASNCIALGDRCVGYTHSSNASSSDNKYYSKMYPTKGVSRIPTAGTDMYIRNAAVKNGLTCNEDVQGGPSNLWESYEILDNMTREYKCDLAHNTQGEQQKYNMANSELNNVVQNVENKLDSLTDTGLALSDEMRNQVKKRHNGFRDYENIRSNLGNVRDIITNVSALEEDTDVLLVSDNYKYILWSILAIVFVIAGIKISRK